jgi:hypothetical protein
MTRTFGREDAIPSARALLPRLQQEWEQVQDDSGDIFENN